MSEWKFHAPGFLKDFRRPAEWHSAMLEEAQSIVQILAGYALGKDPADLTNAEIESIRGDLAYVDPTVTQPPEDAQTVPIKPWPAFPRAVERRAPWKEYSPVDGDESGNFRAVEHLGDEDHRSGGVFVDQHDRLLHLPVRDRQDEYLEWAAERDGDGNITKISFVAEGYDYFSRLFESEEGSVLDLYREFTKNNKLRVDDLRARHGVFRRHKDGSVDVVVKPGEFNPRNRHNINPGIVHLSHRANSLGAEVNLAGVSGIARKNSKGELVDGADAELLLCCNQGGNPNRNSDPLISQQAYRLVLDKHQYTLANPVGLYIASVEEQGLLLPDNSTPVPREWWREVRGAGLWSDESRVLRLELAIPPSEKLTISDLIVGGAPAQFPGQVAALLNVHLFVTLWKRATIGPTVKCEGTCCVIKGTDRLVPSAKGVCEDGAELRFPDLVPGQHLGTEQAPAWGMRGAR
jgi:hypothetical protein